MKKIGFLYGDERNFSESVMDSITKINHEILVESVELDIINHDSNPNYNVILDRFSNSIPFYKYAMNYFSLMGTKIVNGIPSCSMVEDFSVLLLLKQKKINIPKTAIIPSKALPAHISGEDMHNLKYPLD